MDASPEYWRKCSSCKKPIGFRALYWVCNVSTCNRKRTGLVFCTVACWDAHVPMMNHRDSWALEKRSPSAEEWAREQLAESEKTAAAEATEVLKQQSPQTQKTENTTMTENTEGGEVLVVASKIKAYIRAKSGMNTSGAVLEALSGKIRQLCDQAIENAKQDGRKTVMDRDFG